MVRRPRSHVLETASEKALLNLIPDEWTHEFPRHDYGIDMRVSIWSPDFSGVLVNDNGLEFAVQLKAIDGETSQAMKVAVDWNHIHYWQSLTYPVLVVRHLAASGDTYAMWVHDRCRKAETKRTKQAWFRFVETDKLDAAAITRLADQVKAFRMARNRGISLPLELRLTGTMADPATELRLNTSIAKLVGRGRLVASASTWLNTEIFVQMEPDVLTVNFGGGIAISVYFDPAEHQPDHVDLLLAVGVCFARCGSFAEAIEFIRPGSESPLVGQPLVLFASVASCIEFGDIDLALPLLERSDPRLDSTTALVDLMVNNLDRMNGDEFQRLSKLHATIIINAQPGPDRATALARRAQMLREGGRHIEATLDLSEALKENDDLRRLPQYWYSRAGSEFLLERFAAVSSAPQRKTQRRVMGSEHSSANRTAA